MPAETVIVGGGISGLATAYYLGRHGISSTIIEKASRLGGLVKTDLIQGCRLEAGPDSYVASKPSVTELARDLGGMAGEIIEPNHRMRRVFILRDGKLVPMPPGMVMMVPGQWGPVLRSNLFSIGTKLRLLAEPFSRPRSRPNDVSAGELIEEHFGREILDYIAEPLLCGVYGGRASDLSAASVLPRFLGYEQKYGSLISGVRANAAPKGKERALFLSFRNGMQQLTDGLDDAVRGHSRIIVQTEVTAVSRTNKGWRIEAGGHSTLAPHLVMACPSHVCARLLQNVTPELAAELGGIPYSSAILVTLVFDRRELRHPLNGFGFLVPEKERRVVAAATWISTKFPSRIPSHLAAVRGFIVGAQAQDAMTESEENLVETVKDEFRRIMGVQASPLFSTVHKLPASMPQYVVNHLDRLARIYTQLAQLEGLHLVGNAYEGVGIPDCVRLAKDTADRIANLQNSSC